MYKVIKTNKKAVIHQFSTFEELDLYAEKNRYGQGSIDLFLDGQKIEAVSNLYNLASYCLDLNLAKRKLK